jgi:hypothetical protein
MFPHNMDREEFAEGKRLVAEYLSRIARANGEKRTELIVECAEKLYRSRAQRRIGLVKSVGDISPLLGELRCYQSLTVMPLLAVACLDDCEIEAIRLALAGRESELLGEIALRLPMEAAVNENSGSAPKDVLLDSEDPIAAKRRAQVDEYIDEVFRVKKKRIFRTTFWKAAGYRGANKMVGLQPGPRTPDGVYARVVDGRTLYVNTTQREQRIPIEGRRKGIISGREYDGALILGPQDADLIP